MHQRPAHPQSCDSPLNVLRADGGVQNISLTPYANAVGCSQLLALGTA